MVAYILIYKFKLQFNLMSSARIGLATGPGGQKGAFGH
jgi:hypothetical protein